MLIATRQALVSKTKSWRYRATTQGCPSEPPTPVRGRTPDLLHPRSTGKRLALNLQFCTLEERSSATQMKAWGSYRGAIGHEGRKVEVRSKGEALDELVLSEWDFPEHLLTETPLLSPKDIRSACDDLLPALSSLIEMSEKPEHDIGLPKEGLSEHHMSVDMELLAPASPLGMPSPFASGTPGVRSQLEAAAMDICIFARRMPTTARNRQLQREYLQRKRVKDRALFDQVDELEARRAELQVQMASLLCQHEQLARSQPWHDQQEEWSFMASIASCAPGGADEVDAPDQAPLPDLIHSMMLEPDATAANLYASAGLLTPSKDEAASLNTPCPAAKPTADSAATTVPWHQVVKQLDMSKKQREAIAAGYDCYIQSEAFLRDECLDLAAKLQKLPGPVGALTNSWRPNLATHLISSQLAGIAKHGNELTQRLTQTCFQVLTDAQQGLLRQLFSPLPLDVHALCDEVASLVPKKVRAQNMPAAKGCSNQPAVRRKRAAANKPVAAQENACADVCAYVAVKKGNAPDLRKRPRNSDASGRAQ
ncbi:hypothetical protein WJX75_004394 [Coccomyxa subellipsoidea]|uniref:BZIP domain-containing protein n=1 Tax=Coccomyxa subellipsoidea TaxID=248742 RepID=A0ABR2YD87_9CHLO